MKIALDLFFLYWNILMAMKMYFEIKNLFLVAFFLTLIIGTVIRLFYDMKE